MEMYFLGSIFRLLLAHTRSEAFYTRILLLHELRRFSMIDQIARAIQM
jgi:DNA-binding transcriptional regulator PaaX